jgi:hypothetical protein
MTSVNAVPARISSWSMVGEVERAEAEAGEVIRAKRVERDQDQPGRRRGILCARGRARAAPPRPRRAPARRRRLRAQRQAARSALSRETCGHVVPARRIGERNRRSCRPVRCSAVNCTRLRGEVRRRRACRGRADRQVRRGRCAGSGSSWSRWLRQYAARFGWSAVRAACPLPRDRGAPERGIGCEVVHPESDGG